MTECRCHRFFKDMLHCTSQAFDAQCGAQKACDCSTPFLMDGFGGCSEGRVDTSKDAVAWHVSNEKECAQAGCARENYEAMCNPNHKPKPRPATPATPAKLDQCDCTRFWSGQEQFPDFYSEEKCKPDYENKGRDGDFICVQKDCSEAQYGAICGDKTSCDCSKKYEGQQNCSVKVFELKCGRRN